MQNLIIILLILLIHLKHCFAKPDSSYCLSTDPHPYSYFSSKTHYGFVAGKDSFNLSGKIPKGKYVFFIVIFKILPRNFKNIYCNHF